MAESTIPLVNPRVAVAATLVLASLQSIPVSAAQRSAEERETARAVPTDTAIRVDGRLDEPAWKAAPAIAQFLQKDPHEGQAATERTEIRILYTKSSIYFAIRCDDSEPSRILATELRRDNEFLSDDSISILLDTLHDNRSGYLFRTNPKADRGSLPPGRVDRLVRACA